MPFLAVRLKDAKGEHLITDKGKTLERLTDRFDDVLNCPSTINEEAINRATDRCKSICGCSISTHS